MEKLILEATNICKSFSGVQVLNKAHIKAFSHEVHALLGENGAGKSTLVKILTGALKKDVGEIFFDDKPLIINHPKEIYDLGIAIVHQEFNLMPDLSVSENIFIGREPSALIPGFINDKQLRNQTREILNRLKINIDPSTKIKYLGVAQQQLVEIAKALSYECKLIILDEPTSALTDSECETLFSLILSLKKEGVAFIYITHRLSDLESIADRVTILRDGKFVNEHIYDRSKVPLYISEMVGRELNNIFPEKPIYTRGEKTLSVKNLNITGLLHDISFDLYKGEILGVAGLMGAGRTELAKAIIGALPISSGEIEIFQTKRKINSPAKAIKLGFGYLSEDRKRDGLLVNLSIKDNILLSSLDKYTSFGFVSEKFSNNDVDIYMSKLRIKSQGRNQLVLNLSGGNQQKVNFAKWLCKNTDILILDEPTRGIDVGSKYEIYEIIFNLAVSGVSLIMISSELPEILGISDRIITMCEGHITGDIPASQASQELIGNLIMSS